MPSPFDLALAKADRVIGGVMMSEWQIGGENYPAVFDESPRMFEGILTNDETRINGTDRSLTLYRTSGYKPKVNHIAEQGENRYLVKAFSFQDGLIILQLE